VAEGEGEEKKEEGKGIKRETGREGEEE